MTIISSPNFSLALLTAVATLGIDAASSLEVATSLLAALPCISVVETTAIEWLVGPFSILVQETTKQIATKSNNTFLIRKKPHYKPRIYLTTE